MHDGRDNNDRMLHVRHALVITTKHNGTTYGDE